MRAYRVPLIFICSLLFLVLPYFVFAEETFTPISNDFPLPSGGSTTLAQVLRIFFNVGIGLAAVLAVIQIAIGGFKYMTEESVPGMSGARDTIRDAVIGLIIVLSTILILEVINPNILNLNFLASATPITSSGASTFRGGEPLDDASALRACVSAGCEVVGSPTSGTATCSCSLRDVRAALDEAFATARASTAITETPIPLETGTVPFRLEYDQVVGSEILFKTPYDEESDPDHIIWNTFNNQCAADPDGGNAVIVTPAPLDFINPVELRCHRNRIPSEEEVITEALSRGAGTAFALGTAGDQDQWRVSDYDPSTGAFQIFGPASGNHPLVEERFRNLCEGKGGEFRPIATSRFECKN